MLKSKKALPTDSHKTPTLTSNTSYRWLNLERPVHTVPHTSWCFFCNTIHIDFILLQYNLELLESIVLNVLLITIEPNNQCNMSKSMTTRYLGQNSLKILLCWFIDYLLTAIIVFQIYLNGNKQINTSECSYSIVLLASIHSIGNMERKTLHLRISYWI